MTTIYSTPLEEQLKEAQRTASRLETENAALKQQLTESVARSKVNAMIDNNRVSDAVTIQSLQHELAEAQGYEPVPDGIHGSQPYMLLVVLDTANCTITLPTAFRMTYPREWVIMRRRTQGGSEK